MRSSTAVKKIDNDGVTDLGANDRAQNSQPIGLRFENREGGVGILNVASLIPLGLSAPGHGNLPGTQNVLASRGIVPGNIFCCDVVMASTRLRNLCRYQRNEDQEQLTRFHESITFNILLPGASQRAVATRVNKSKVCSLPKIRTTMTFHTQLWNSFLAFRTDLRWRIDRVGQARACCPWTYFCVTINAWRFWCSPPAYQIPLSLPVIFCPTAAAVAR